MRRDERTARLLRGGVSAFAMALATGCAGLGSSGDNRPAPADEVSRGYGTTSRENATGAISSLEVDDRGKTGYSRIESLLERVPGLRVLRSSSGGFTLQLRSVGTSFSEPLLVIDGMQIQTDIGTVLATLNPIEVVRIDVLKPESAAIYGMRGGNGVVIITTQRGR